MAASIQLKRCSHRHEAIIDWLLANPGVKNLHVLCRHLNVTRSWLSIVMRSDAFQAEYRRRRELYNQDLAAGIQRKMYNVADIALDRMIEALEDEENDDPRFALDALDKVTNRLGFGPSKGEKPSVAIYNQNNTQIVEKDVLAEARESIRELQKNGPALPEG